MEQINNRYSKPKFTKIEIVFLILAGVFLILAIVDKVIKTSAAEDPTLANYDYCVFIRVNGTECYFSDSIGNYLGSIPTIHNNEEADQFNSALDNLFIYIDPLKSIAFMIDDYAASGPYNYIKSGLASHGVNVLELGDNIFPYNVEGFYLQQYPAGDFSAFVYRRQNIVSPSPSPTPDPNVQVYHILLNHVNGVYNNTSYMVSFKASGILGEYNQPLNSTVESVLLESGSESTLLKYNASIMKTGSYQGSWLTNYYGTGYLFYVKCSSFSDLRLYKNSNAFASENFEYIENNYSYTFVQEGTLQNQGSGYDVFYYVSEIDDGYILAFSFKTGQYGIVSEFNQSSDIWFQEGNINSNASKNYFVPFENNSDQYKLALSLMLDVNNNAIPDPNITPTPSPSPVPTSAPYVQLITPPLPSPVGTIGFQDPGYSKLNSGQVSNEFDGFEDKLQNNQALGLLAVAFGFVPLEIRSIVWLILLIAVILATLRVFLHFFS